VSVSANFQIGKALGRSANKRSWLWLGVVFNLGLLAYFKYAYFILDNVGVLLLSNWSVGEIVLPLAISFFTFQQIAWLVDLSNSRVQIPKFLNYALFVSFFPQLIAGPIVHHAEIMPQFQQRPARKAVLSHLNVGLTLFTLGLFKKVVLADQFALFATPVFDAALRGDFITLLEAWAGTLAYTLQIYFDFSGYSDMAVGLARMFGIVLPVNFFSPYKAQNIRQFWQRWHMTLSRFLRDYLYIPLGGNRKTASRVGMNVLITMLIGGLWHGAAWTFVAWGGLHGIYLIVARSFHHWRKHQMPVSRWAKSASIFCTFIAVMLGWVLFRAESFEAALQLYRSMFGFSGFALPSGLLTGIPEVAGPLQALGVKLLPLPYLQGLPELLWLSVGCAICFLTPNSYEFMSAYNPVLLPPRVDFQPSRLRWIDSPRWAVIIAVLFTWSILALNRVSEFLYFQF
jgi:D-alanyl-lipoteichoic acid acyltransferase DltB (MBOAT superfamily)